VADTVLGKISISHNPSSNLGGPRGVWLKNTISITTTFKEDLVFEDAISHTFTLLNFLGILAGRPQNILSLSLRIKSDAESPGIFQVYWSIPPRRDKSKERENPHPSDVLMDAVREAVQCTRRVQDGSTSLYTKSDFENP